MNIFRWVSFSGAPFSLVVATIFAFSVLEFTVFAPAISVPIFLWRAASPQYQLDAEGAAAYYRLHGPNQVQHLWCREGLRPD
jgi:hypothetical protein